VDVIVPGAKPAPAAGGAPEAGKGERRKGNGKGRPGGRDKSGEAQGGQ
jgi:hypothetical protein